MGSRTFFSLNSSFAGNVRPWCLGWLPRWRHFMTTLMAWMPGVKWSPFLTLFCDRYTFLGEMPSFLQQSRRLLWLYFVSVPSHRKSTPTMPRWAASLTNISWLRSRRGCRRGAQPTASGGIGSISGRSFVNNRRCLIGRSTRWVRFHLFGSYRETFSCAICPMPGEACGSFYSVIKLAVSVSNMRATRGTVYDHFWIRGRCTETSRLIDFKKWSSDR